MKPERLYSRNKTSLCAIRFLERIGTCLGNDRHGVLEKMVARDGIEPRMPAFSGPGPREVGVTSESQNSPVSTNGVNSAMTQSVRIPRKIKKALKSGLKQQAL